MRRIIYSYLILFAVGYCDYITGPEARFGSLYLLIVAFMGWDLSRRALLIYASATVGMWIFTEWMAHVQYSKEWFLFWNTFNKFASIAIAAFMVLKTRKVLFHQQNLIRDLRETSLNLTRLKEIVPICRICRELHFDDVYRAKVKEVLGNDMDAESVGDICPECLAARAEHLAQIPIDSYFEVGAS